MGCSSVSWRKWKSWSFTTMSYPKSNSSKTSNKSRNSISITTGLDSSKCNYITHIKTFIFGPEPNKVLENRVKWPKKFQPHPKTLQASSMAIYSYESIYLPIPIGSTIYLILRDSQNSPTWKSWNSMAMLSADDQGIVTWSWKSYHLYTT